jgi:hypothetical protein
MDTQISRDKLEPQGLNRDMRARSEPDHPKTLSVPEAGRRYFDLGRNASYDAARRGEIPTIRIGSRIRVPIIALERMLAEAGTRQSHDRG